MFAVIRTGGKQYKVAANEVIRVELLDGAAGDSITFPEVLMVGGADGTVLGSPLVEGASVVGEVVDQTRTRKVLVFKKRRRQNSRRTRGHRQHVTVVRIKDILTAGGAPAPAAEAEE
jgi:large subunit ribosomal protein L21